MVVLFYGEKVSWVTRVQLTLIVRKTLITVGV